jgi:required for meiotic nuclear division protein 1
MQTGMFKPQVNFKQVIGYCSLIHGAVISQLGLMDKNDLAWQYAKYDNMVEIMRVEFELEKRIRHLQDKIGVVARDAATFVSFQQNDKSHLLELLIVGLIAAEIIVSLTDMTLRTFGHV